MMVWICLGLSAVCFFAAVALIVKKGIDAARGSGF